MATATPKPVDNAPPKASRGWRLVVLLGPLLLLAGVIALFWLTDGAGLQAEPAAPIETVAFQRPILNPGEIVLRLRNTSPGPITLSAVNINDAILPFTVSPQRTIPRFGEATVTLPYHWVKGAPYRITLFSTNSVAFDTEIGVAAETATATTQTLLSFTLVGIYVGVIPVILGMLWLPAIRSLSARAMVFLMALTVGLLLYLGVEATSEAIDLAGSLDGSFQGIGIVAIGVIGTVLLLEAIGRRQQGAARTESGQRLTLAFLIAVGIGLHNLGEGLAIGSAYAIGEAALGAFFVIGFIIQNITEGFGIVVPIARDKPSLRTLALLGLIGGAPAIAGAWIGGLVDARPLSVLFLAIGAGAVFQVAYQIGRELVWRKDVKRPMPLTAFAGVTAGMLMLYATGVILN